jgi:hypothetical protein
LPKLFKEQVANVSAEDLPVVITSAAIKHSCGINVEMIMLLVDGKHIIR